MKAKASKKKKIVTPAPVPARSRYDFLQYLFWLVVFVLLAFGQTIDHQFVSLDDITHIQRNPAFNPFTLQSLWDIWTKPYFDMYLPMTYTLWGIAAKLGLEQTYSLTTLPVISPLLFRGANLLVHTLNAFLVLFIVRRLSNSTQVAFISAAFFALHPLQAEAVSWISAMKDLWSGFFALAAILFYVRSRQDVVNKIASRSYAFSIVLFILATLAKPSMVSVPVILFCLELFFFKTSLVRTLRAITPFALLSLPPILWSKALQPDTSMQFVPPLWARPLIAGDALTFYLGKIFVPLSFGIDYGRSPQAVLASATIYFVWLIPLVLLAVAWIKRNNALFAAGAFSFCLSFLPYSGLVLFNFQDFSSVADRYAYLPMFGASLALAGIVQKYFSLTLRNCCYAALALLAVMSNKQAASWENSTTLFAHALHVNPVSPIALTNLGVSLMDQGRTSEAVPYFQRVSTVQPQSGDGPINLGLAYSRLGRSDEAIAEFKKAIELNSNSSAAYLNLGNVYQQLNRFDEAIAAYNIALKTRPDDLGLLVNLGNAYLGQKNFAAAVAEYNKALQMDPKFSGALINLGYALQQSGDNRGAVEFYERAASLVHNHSGLYTNLALAYRALGDTEQAKKNFRSALAVDPHNAVAKDNLNQLLAGGR